MSLKLTSINFSSVKRPLRTIWALGSDWGSAVALCSADIERGHLSLRHLEDLKFEVEYSYKFGSAHVGVSYSLLDGQSDTQIAKAFESVVTQLLAPDHALLTLGINTDRLSFDEVCFGVAGAWIESPRLYKRAVNRHIILGSLPELKRIYEAGAGKPIIMELLTGDGRVWLGFSISGFHDGRFRIDESALADLVEKTLKL